MVELKKDEQIIEVVENKIQIQREIVEEFDAEEYIRRYEQMAKQKEQMEKQMEEMVNMMTKIESKLDEAKEIREVEVKEMEKERAEALAKAEIETGDLEK